MSNRITAGNVKLKRAYERPDAEDGTRVLIDRLWPRGVRKEVHNDAVALRDFLLGRRKKQKPKTASPAA